MKTMAISTAMRSTGDIQGDVLMRFLNTAFTAEQQLRQPYLADKDLLANESSSKVLLDDDGGMPDPLLMPVWAYQTAAAYLIVISIVGLVLNMLVIIVILTDRQMTVLNWMLLNLACSDGLIAAFGTPVSASAALQHGWPFSDELCVVYAMIMSTAGIGSITTLTALALWRCQLVVYCPAKRSSAFANNNGGRLGHCQAFVLLAIIWTYSLAVTCPPLFGWGRYDREASHISCSVNWESKMDNNRLYIVYMFVFGLLVPLAVIIVAYVSILRVVRKAGKFKRTASTASHNVEQPHGVADQQQMATKRVEQKKQTSDTAEKRVTVMVACMVGAFMTAWTPYSISALFETFIGDTGSSSNSHNVSSYDNLFYYAGTISPGFATVPSLFAKTSTVFNPLIYGLLNTQFRTAWEKFSTRFLGRQRPTHHNSNQQRAVNSGTRQYRCGLLNCVGNSSSALKPSATVHVTVKEIVSNESVSYVMATTVRTSPATARFFHGEQSAGERAKSPSFPLMPIVEPVTMVRTTSFKDQLKQPMHQQEQPAKFVVVCLATNSTRCRIRNDLLPGATNESVL